MTDQPENYVLLETVRRDRDNKKNLLFRDPVEIISCTRARQIQQCFRRMALRRRQGFHLAGFFSYELGYLLEDTLSGLRPTSDFPLLWFGVYEKPEPFVSPRETEACFYPSEAVLAASTASYKKAVAKIRNYIAAGDTYQINYTTRFNFTLSGDVRAFYEALKQNQKVSYSALISFGKNAVISLSPELFFRTDKQGNITVKPMKGTAPLTAGSWLQNDAKNRSENVMIVDLLRNDLGRICKPGTVRVQKLFALEEYETLLQMTSTVKGRLQSGLTIHDLMRSLFPCGSVTGAPKIRSMEIIRELEDAPRDLYTGAIGYFAPNGESVFNVGIRTLDLRQEEPGRYQAVMGVGSGIVFDSNPEEEYAECLLKATFLQNTRPDFALLETLRVEDGRIRRLPSHLRRLKTSAVFFNIPCSQADIRRRLSDFAAKISGKAKVRLLLKANGSLILQSSSLPEKPAGQPKIAFSCHRTSSSDLFVRHKTTFRKVYDDEHERYSAKGFFDVIFLNEKGQITEGAISNIFLRLRNQWFTPPVACGLLPGIARQHFIKKWNVAQKILYPSHLQRADQIVLTNAIRGATEVILGG